MKFKVFCIPYTEDERMIYAGEYLLSKGYESVESADRADFVVLPIPVKNYMLEGLEGKTVFYGCGNYDGYDYNKNEAFLLQNAFFTSEGAIALFKENCDISIYNAKILIVGYGRIAQSLHKALNALGADVTVCSRSDESRVLAKKNGARCISFDELDREGSYDAVFNTVPAVVFTKKEIDAFDSNTVYFELASFPGGIDMHYAKHKKIRLVDGRGLPSRYSKKSAGILIGKTVDEMIKGGLI